MPACFPAGCIVEARPRRTRASVSSRSPWRQAPTMRSRNDAMRFAYCAPRRSPCCFGAISTDQARGGRVRTLPDRWRGRHNRSPGSQCRLICTTRRLIDDESRACFEPAGGEFRATIRHVPAAEHPECEHFLGREFRAKFRIEVSSRRRCQLIAIAVLHLIVHACGFKLSDHRTSVMDPCALVNRIDPLLPLQYFPDGAATQA